MYDLAIVCARICRLCTHKALTREHPAATLESIHTVSVQEAIDASPEACLLHEARQNRQTI